METVSTPATTGVTGATDPSGTDAEYKFVIRTPAGLEVTGHGCKSIIETIDYCRKFDLVWSNRSAYHYEPKTAGNPVLKAPNSHRVTVLKDSSLEMEQLWLEVWVEGDKFEQQNFSNWLLKSRCTKAQSPETADLVIFTGGTDVDPRLYGAEPMSSTDTPDVARDAREINLYQMCVTNGIPMMGICRGAQLLAVMNGAKLYQHVDNHNGPHDIFDLRNRRVVSNISSVHHQMVVEDKKGGMEVIADNSKARNRFLSEGVNRPGTHADVEAFFYRDTVCLGIQGHPEYTGYAGFARWATEVMAECFLENPDLELRVIEESSSYKYRRVKEDLLLERKHRLRPILAENVNA